MAQSQYATDADIQKLAITPAAYQRFEAISPGCVTAALQSASSKADDYLSSQFLLPLKTVPQGWDMGLTETVCWLAAYSLYFKTGFNPSSPDWQVMTERRKEAMEWLDGIGKKTISPSYSDSSSLSTDADRAGDFVISDPPVGFTSRGATDTTLSFDNGWWW
jgi:phage gp36-like protein